MSARSRTTGTLTDWSTTGLFDHPDPTTLCRPLTQPPRTVEMIEIGAYEAKTKLPELLRRIELGERFKITRNGHPVAELGPIGADVAPDRDHVIEQLKGFARGQSLGSDLSLKQLIEEGRQT